MVVNFPVCPWTLWTLSLPPSLYPQVQPDWFCCVPTSPIIAKALKGKVLANTLVLISWRTARLPALLSAPHFPRPPES